MAAKKHEADKQLGYPIGVTARLTGIHPETLRVWERRYDVVTPTRASRGRRFYSAEDVQRLTLLKALVADGNPVGAVAGLSMDELEARRTLTKSLSGRAAAPAQPPGPCRVIAVGDTLPVVLRGPQARALNMEIVAALRDVNQARPEHRRAGADAMVLEQASLQSDAARRIVAQQHVLGAARAIVVYGFAARHALQELDAAGVAHLQAPASIEAIARACRQARPASPGAAAEAPVSAVPARRFGPEQLARIALSSPAMACECPHHLVDLINSLVAFETYSSECESRNEPDAQIHAFLHSVSATARSLLERGLERVVAHEGISVE
jgi:MerR family transcriptional regulator, light-induced transcriptional regulator